MDRYEVPEIAVAACERVLGATITVHDASGLVARHLRVFRDAHRHPRCLAAKARDASAACVRHDQRELAPLLDRHPHGLLQRCFAALGEAVVPLAIGGGPSGCLFAGPFTPAAGVALVRDGGRRPPAGLPEWDGAQAGAALECLRQLAARLALAAADAPAAVPATRRGRILHFVERHYCEEVSLADLAAELGLSPGRAAHVVRAECGASFVQLLTDARLDHAAGLLRHSALDITAVALASGFGDVSHFHRRFRRRFAATPLAWRTAAPA
jgi:AraC-like DNA-binding protein